MVQVHRVEAPLRAWLRVGEVAAPARMGVPPTRKPAIAAVNLVSGDEVHLAGDDIVVVRPDGAYAASLWPPGPPDDPRNRHRPRETLAAFVAVGTLSPPSHVEPSVDRRSEAAARAAASLPRGTPVDRAEGLSPALQAATDLLRDAADAMADAGLRVRLSGAEATFDRPARAILSTPLGDVALVANAFGYLMARMPVRFPCDAGKVETEGVDRVRVARFGPSPGASANARRFLEDAVPAVLDACGIPSRPTP